MANLLTTDALADASIKNVLTSPDQIKYWRKTLFNQGTPTEKQILEGLDKILSKTTIKRACCLGGSNPNSFDVNVRIPIPKNYAGTIPDTNKKFGYIDKSIKVPSYMCTGLPGPNGLTNYVKPNTADYSSPCDDFYSVYCANMRAAYNEEYQTAFPGKPPDPDLFSSEYKKECACLNPNPTFPPTFLSPLCLMYPNCTKANNDLGYVYLDPLSRKPCPDNVTICQQVIDLSNTKAGGSLNISPELKNQCSSQSGSTINSTNIKTTGATQGNGNPVTGGKSDTTIIGPGSSTGATGGPSSGPTDSNPSSGDNSGAAGATSGAAGATSGAAGATGATGGTGATSTGSTGDQSNDNYIGYINNVVMGKTEIFSNPTFVGYTIGIIFGIVILIFCCLYCTFRQ